MRLTARLGRKVELLDAFVRASVRLSVAVPSARNPGSKHNQSAESPSPLPIYQSLVRSRDRGRNKVQNLHHNYHHHLLKEVVIDTSMAQSCPS